MLKLVRIGKSKKAQHKKAVYTLVCGRVFSVGRKGSNLSFEDDTSISRSHAEIEIEHPQSNMGSPSLVPSVSVTDIGSKFGTYINDGIESQDKVPLREAQILAAGDRFRFGLQWNEYRVEYTPLVVTTSTLKDVSLLKTKIRSLGGHLLTEWTKDSTYLAMEGIVLTIKVVGALVFGRSIVTPAYFEDYLEAVLEGISQGGDYDLDQHLPDAGNYLPPLLERSLTGKDDLFRPSSGRSKIFRGKHFILSDEKAMKNYSSIIIGGGGKCGLLAAIDGQVLRNDSTILMGDENLLRANVANKTKIELYFGSGKRSVPEREIGLAVLYEDASVYTNPKAAKPTRLVQVIDTQPADADDEPTQRSVIPETQEDGSQHVFHTLTPLGRSVIEESVNTTPHKREREDTSCEEKPTEMNKRRRKELTDDKHKQNSELSKQTQNSESEKQKQKRLAALFCMSDNSDEEDNLANAPPAPVMSLKRSATIRQTGAGNPRPAEAKPMETSTRASTSANSPLRRSGRNRGHVSMELEIPPTQDSHEQALAPSGICPASPEFSETPPTSPGSLMPSSTILESTSTNITTRSKRRPEDEEETQAIGAAGSRSGPGSANESKRRRVLGDGNEDEGIIQVPSTEVMKVTTNGYGGNENRENMDDFDRVQPLGYSFASLVLDDSLSRERYLAVASRENQSTNTNGGVNFKKFRKVVPTFAHAPMTFTLIPHDIGTAESDGIATVEVMNNAMPAAAADDEPAAAVPRTISRGRRKNQNGHEPAAVVSPRRGGRRVPQIVQHEEDVQDEFSFH